MCQGKNTPTYVAILAAFFAASSCTKKGGGGGGPGPAPIPEPPKESSENPDLDAPGQTPAPSSTPPEEPQPLDGFAALVGVWDAVSMGGHCLVSYTFTTQDRVTIDLSCLDGKYLLTESYNGAFRRTDATTIEIDLISNSCGAESRRESIKFSFLDAARLNLDLGGLRLGRVTSADKRTAADLAAVTPLKQLRGCFEDGDLRRFKAAEE